MRSNKSVHSCQFAFLLFVTLCAACTDRGASNERLKSHPLARTVDADSQLTEEDFDLGDDHDGFVLRYGFGSGQYGYDVLTIHGDQTCQYTFSRWTRRQQELYQAWFQCQFSVSDDQFSTLLELLRSDSFRQLKSEYHADIVDGTQVFLGITAPTERKMQIYCNNHFPDTIVEWDNLMIDLLRTHGDVITNAIPIDAPTAEEQSEFFRD